MSRMVTLCLFLLISAGCARTAVVKFWQPPEADVSNLDKIMVMDFTGDQGPSVSKSLTGQLGNQNIYSIVEASPSQSLFQLTSFRGEKNSTGDSSTTLNAVLASARSQGVDGVVTGEVIEYRCEDKPVRKARFRPGQDPVADEEEKSDFRFRDLNDAVMREARVTVAFRLVDVDSGEVRAEHQVTHDYQQVIDKAEQNPDQKDVLQDLTKLCLQDIVSYLAPHEVTSQVRLAQCDPLTRYRREVRDAVMQAQSGKWDDAERKLKAVIEKDPNNHAALFNLAVVADHRRDYKQAEDLAMQALRIQYKECYAAGLEQIRVHRNAANKVNDQRDAQVTKVFAELWR